MATTYIPEQWYCGFRQRVHRDQKDLSVYGDMTPEGTDKPAIKRKATIARHCSKDYQPLIFDNTPQYGFKFDKFNYSTTSYGTVSIYDPRGFYADMPIENFQELMKTVTMRDGEIMKQCVWVRQGRSNRLTTVDSDEYKEFKRTTDGLKQNYKLKDVAINDTVTLKNGFAGQYLGSFSVIQFTRSTIDDDPYNGKQKSQTSYQALVVPQKYKLLFDEEQGEIVFFSSLNIVNIDKPTGNSPLNLLDYEQFLNDNITTRKVPMTFNTWSQSGDSIIGLVTKKQKDYKFQVDVVNIANVEHFWSSRKFYHLRMPVFAMANGKEYIVCEGSYDNTRFTGCDCITKNLVVDDLCTMTQHLTKRRYNSFYHSSDVSGDDTKLSFEMQDHPMSTIQITWHNDTLGKTYKSSSQ